jgi:hypothetical protein
MQDVVLGREYLIHVGGDKEEYNQIAFGVAKNILHGKLGDKVTLNFTRVEVYRHGVMVEEQDVNSTGSVFPHRLVPTPQA